MVEQQRLVEVAPAVLAATPEDYARDLDVATSVADRIQVDLVDGKFASNRTVNLEQVYWPEGVRADLHLMYDDPCRYLETLIALSPHLVIVHHEAREATRECYEGMREQLQGVDIQFGLGILPSTVVEDIAEYVPRVDHVLVFTGELGHYGGELQMVCLDKIGQLKRLNPHLEVGVDGGINADNAVRVARAGADVLNVGGFIQRASRPEEAYATLKEVISQAT